LNDIAKKKRAKASKSSPEKMQPLVPKLDLSLLQVETLALPRSLSPVHLTFPCRFLPPQRSHLPAPATGSQQELQHGAQLLRLVVLLHAVLVAAGPLHTPNCPSLPGGSKISSELETTALCASTFALPATYCEYNTVLRRSVHSRCLQTKATTEAIC
jgi:hypothetical protein